MQELKTSEEVWDKKKIVITVLITVVISAGLVYSANILGLIEFQKPLTKNSSSKSIYLPSKIDVEDKLEEVKQEINALDIAEIASSSPQVKKILQDLRFLQEYPGNQAREMCQRICSSL